MNSIADVLKQAALALAHSSDSAKLDAELLLTHVLKKPRSYLYSWPEKQLESVQEQAFYKLVQARQTGQPIAYLLGEKEFWSLSLTVNPHVLIPRPDTEILVESVLELIQLDYANIADLGTGSGAIALALAYERPHWQIYATDYSETALATAKANASKLKINNIEFKSGSWCEALPTILFDAIVSNPPYIAEDDLHLGQGDVRFEPRSALVAQNRGLADIDAIAKQAQIYLKPGAYLVFEHGHDQAEAVKDILLKYGYQHIVHQKDLAGILRVTFARSPTP